MRTRARKLATASGTYRALAVETGKPGWTTVRAVSRMQLIMNQVSMAFEKWQCTYAYTDEEAGEYATTM